MKLWVWMISLCLFSMFAADPALSDPPPGKGGGKQEDGERGKGKAAGKNRSDDGRQGDRDRQAGSGRDRPDARDADRSRSSITVGRHFDDRQRSAVREYFVTEYRSGHCPPGLAKKNNGCMPPGQAKKWSIGHPLPREVIFYDLSPSLVVRIGTPPPGYRYVRVAADILLIAVGTGMVIDAITDLGNL